MFVRRFVDLCFMFNLLFEPAFHSTHFRLHLGHSICCHTSFKCPLLNQMYLFHCTSFSDCVCSRFLVNPVFVHSFFYVFGFHFCFISCLPLFLFFLGLVSHLFSIVVIKLYVNFNIFLLQFHFAACLLLALNKKKQIILSICVFTCFILNSAQSVLFFFVCLHSPARSLSLSLTFFTTLATFHLPIDYIDSTIS